MPANGEKITAGAEEHINHMIDNASAKPLAEPDLPIKSENQPSTGEDMETHAHHLHKAPGQGWKHYFFEFLMLFLAVFCGFLAENLREHFVEREREIEFMESMIKDLEMDVSNADINIGQRIQTIERCNSILRQLGNGIHADRTASLYYDSRMISAYYNFFIFTDGTLQQLKNSGGLRLIKNRQVVDGIQAYENRFAQFDRDQQLEQQQLAAYRDQMVRVFDVRIFEKMLQSDGSVVMPEGHPRLFSTHQELINEFLMRVHFLKKNNISNHNAMTELKIKAQNLIALIKKEYHFK